MRRCGERERRHWLEILSLHMLHRRAARMAMVRYLHPLAGVPRLDTPQLDRPQALEYRKQTQ